MESKQSSLTGFKATIAEEKEDVQKRATYPLTGQIEFDYGAGKREFAPDGKSSSQRGGRGIARYRYSKADQRWELVDCAPPPNFMLPKPEDRVVEFQELYRLFLN